MQTKAYRLLGILQEYAPSWREAHLCTIMYHKAYFNGATEREVERMLVGAMVDGIDAGNWPWVVNDFGKDQGAVG